MPHRFPALPAFIDQPGSSPISEVALRVVVELPDWEFHIVGTACVIGANLAITAAHVVDEITDRFGARIGEDGGREVDDYNIRLYQVMPGPIYRIWSVDIAWVCPFSDLALLHLQLHATAGESGPLAPWKLPLLRAFPPPVGERVLSFGYRESVFNVTEDEAQHHLELNDRPTMSGGYVRQVFPGGRDQSLLTFPCFEIEARFDGGMSGGLVVDELGRLCGLISVGTNDDPAVGLPPVGYAVTLWPIFATLISAPRASGHSAALYPAIELARDGVVSIDDRGTLEALMPTLIRTLVVEST